MAQARFYKVSRKDADEVSERYETKAKEKARETARKQKSSQTWAALSTNER